MTTLPRLQRTAPKIGVGIVHFGPGAFFRAFNAPFTQDALAASPGDWGIVAVSLKSSTAQEALAPQDFAYTAVELASAGKTAQIINTLCEVLVAPDNPQAVVDQLINPQTRLVSLTITEKGYCHNPATGKLDLGHPDIAHDLTTPDQPRSALGFIVEALAKRRHSGAKPFTVLSCDNLPSNGALLRKLVLELAAIRDSRLAEWIEEYVPFPSTMVDRITPATTEKDITSVEETEGYFDPACVFHEPFRQWVIEDNFTQGRPAWELSGAQLVESVDAHELMKLRCLNGTHSALAYLGYLAGYETIAETVADTSFAAYCSSLWEQEIVPTVPCPQGEDLQAYCAALLGRYQNSAIRHRTWQIAMDGSQKLPQRLLATIGDNLKHGHVPRGLCLAVAGWMRYVGGIDEQGRSIDVRDPLAERLKIAATSQPDAQGKVDALLAFDDIFDRNLSSQQVFHQAISSAYNQLHVHGVRSAIRHLLDTPS